MRDVCPKCHTGVPAAANFCSQCGWKLVEPYGARAFTLKGVIILASVAFGVCLAGLWMQRQLGGKRPAAAMQRDQTQSAGHSAPAERDPALAQLYEAVDAEPENQQKLWALANALIEKANQTESAPPQSVMEIVQVLGRILKINPQDKDALLSMADITFSSSVYDKSAQYYARYLALDPGDSNIRARYGNVLTFTGKVDEAIKELQSVVAKDPGHFHASVYLAYAYAQKGDMVASRAISEQALALAPSDEERSKLKSFLSELETAKAGEGKGQS